MHEEIDTLEDLLVALKKLTPEQLKMPLQVVRDHPVHEYVHKGEAGICLSTVDELGLKYFRSVTDNRRNGDEIVIFTDGNPHGEEGATAYEICTGKDEVFGEVFGSKNPIFPDGHNDECDWTGPAQKIIDEIDDAKDHTVCEKCDDEGSHMNEDGTKLMTCVCSIDAKTLSMLKHRMKKLK